MNYEEMSDFEINCYVSMHMHGFSWIEFVDGYVSSVKCGNEGSPGFAMVEVCDYCNSPSDAWPIIVASKIWIQPDMVGDGFWHCYDCENEHFSKHQNPLRAAMIVFIMIHGESK